MRRFAKFNAIGLLGTLLQLFLIVVLGRFLRLPAVAATPVAVELVLLHNFFWHERFTWRDRESAGFQHAVIRLLRFHAANGLVSLAGNTALTYYFMEKFNAPVLPAALTAIALCAPANFLLADFWIFRPTRQNGKRRGILTDPGVEYASDRADESSSSFAMPDCGHGARPKAPCEPA